MRKTQVSVFVAQSLDGYIASENDSLDWLESAASPGEDYGFSAFVSSVDLIAMGSTTYEHIKDVEYLPYQGRQVHVFTSRAYPSRQGFEFYARSPHEAMRYWEAEGISRVYLDGGSLISQFLEVGLVDDLTITTVPILLGSGKRLFRRITRHTALELRANQSYPAGMLQSRYHRVDAPVPECDAQAESNDPTT